MNFSVTLCLAVFRNDHEWRRTKCAHHHTCWSFQSYQWYFCIFGCCYISDEVWITGTGLSREKPGWAMALPHKLKFSQICFIYIMFRIKMRYLEATRCNSWTQNITVMPSWLYNALPFLDALGDLEGGS